MAGSRSHARRALLSLVAALAGVAPLHAQASQDCSVLGENTFVRDTLDDIYLWYRQLPALSPALYPSPEAYLEAVRYRPIDDTFSFISDKVSDTAFFSDSQFVGFGVATRFVGSALRVTDVFEGSPAANAGLERGDRILALGGRTVDDLVATGDFGGAFGPSQIGFTLDVAFLDRAGSFHAAVMTKALVTIPTVSSVQVYDVGGTRVGYLLFRNFVTPSNAALDSAFERLRSAGATRLVLDLRYNGGGLVSVAQHLASLVAGPRLDGKVMVAFSHNDKHTELDTVYRFEDAPQALGSSDLVVIATRSTASASEIIVNSLRPYLNVTVVGDTTYGKPVGQYGYDFCDKVLHPVAFSLRNVLGQGDYYQGIPADCTAADDIDHLLGDPAEASLAESLYFLANGQCSPAGRIHAAERARREPRPSGLPQLIGAH